MGEPWGNLGGTLGEPRAPAGGTLGEPRAATSVRNLLVGGWGNLGGTSNTGWGNRGVRYSATLARNLLVGDPNTGWGNRRSGGQQPIPSFLVRTPTGKPGLENLLVGNPGTGWGEPWGNLEGTLGEPWGNLPSNPDSSWGNRGVRYSATLVRNLLVGDPGSGWGNRKFGGQQPIPSVFVRTPTGKPGLGYY